MNRVEFLRELESGLARVSPDERVAALQYYTEYFDDAGPQQEAQVIEQLGSPSKVAEDILVSWGLGEAPPAAESEGAEETEAGAEAAQARDGQTPAQRAAGAAAELNGRPVPALRLTEMPGTTQQSPHGAPPDLGYRSPPPFRSGEAVPLPPPPMSLQRVGQAAQQAAASASEAVQQVTGRFSAKVILLILAAILLSPAIFGLAGGLLGVVMAAFVVLCVLPAVGVGVLVAGIAVAGVGISIMGAVPASGLLMLGLGLFTAAVGFFLIYGGSKLIGWVIPAVRKGIRALFVKIRDLIRGV